MAGLISVAVTGAGGFLGKNLCVSLQRRGDVQLHELHSSSLAEEVEVALDSADVIFHLAGVNRPKTTEEFQIGNVETTRSIVQHIEASGRRPVVVFASSTQAESDTPYGLSKVAAENELRMFARQTGCRVHIFRLPGIFGKWCRPNYNSVVATFCHNVAHCLPIVVSDTARELELLYVDDVIRTFNAVVSGEEPPNVNGLYSVYPTYRLTLGWLANIITSFRESRTTLQLADFGDELIRKLYATYLSYVPTNEFDYALQQRSDERGVLAELLKSQHFGQVFVSRTRPGITRGDHYHDSKAEKFCVVEGDAVIRFRNILSDEVLEYPVNGRGFRVVDIPPGYTHSIENVGDGEMIVLFWASEVFDPQAPDTHSLKVLQSY
ncbi:MAG: NAD-dependent epimerase/dehydratase family protein [Gemmatimonadota bacterium]